jgi:hypothetical protein
LDTFAIEDAGSRTSGSDIDADEIFFRGGIRHGKSLAPLWIIANIFATVCLAREICNPDCLPFYSNHSLQFDLEIESQEHPERAKLLGEQIREYARWCRDND